MFRASLAVVGGLVGLMALGWAVQGNQFFMYQFFAPKYEQVRYDTFKQSQTYNDGMIRDLENLRIDYLDADDAHKILLRGTILHRFSVYDINRLPPELQQFYRQLVSSR